MAVASPTSSLAATNDDASAGTAAAKATRVEEIEVLRAVAILFTLAQHSTWLLPWKTAPFEVLAPYMAFWAGVDLFFVISGFVITRSLIERVGHAHASARVYWRHIVGFWIRRAWRILPSAWLWLLIVLVCSVAFNFTGAFGPFKNNLLDAFAAVFQVANFYFSWCRSTSGGWCGVNDIYWSLSLEEQFYLILPLILFFGSRKLAAFALLVAAVQIAMPRPAGYALVNLTKTDALLLGVLIALWSGTWSYQALRPRLLHAFPPLRAAVFLVLLVLLAATPAFQSLPIRTGVVSCIGACLVYLASYDDGMLMRDGPLRRVLVFIGLRSYGLYLIHVPAFLMAREIWYAVSANGALGPAQTVPLLALGLPLLFLLSEVNYRWVEVPLRARGRAIAERFERK